MASIGLQWQQESGIYDLTLCNEGEAYDLQGDTGLLSAIIISLFSDSRARDDDILPDEAVGRSSDRRGWWGDFSDHETLPIGSRLWLLWREKDVDMVVLRAEEYAKEALAWLTTDKAGEHRVHEVVVQVKRVEKGYLGIGVQVSRPSGLDDALGEGWNFVYDYAASQLVSIGVPQGIRVR